MDRDGKNRRPLTEGKEAYIRGPVWTPDGEYVVVRKEEARRAGIPPVELWMFHRRGGNGIKLTSSEKLHNASGPVVSKDGRFIYFAARRPRFNYVPDMANGLWNVMRYDRRTSEVVPITTGFGGAVRPALSPDGKTLTFLSRRDADTVLVSRNLETGSERVIARGLSRDDQEGFAQADVWPGYAFTPDGQALIFNSGGKLARVDLASAALTEIPFNAKVEQTLAPLVSWQEKTETGPIAARILRWPNQSADARLIAFDAFGRIWLQEVANGKAVGSPRRLTAGDEAPREYAPTFSPDGKWIAFVTWSDEAGGHVWKTAVPSAGARSQAVRVTRAAGHYANPSWSPGSDRIAIVRGSGLEFRGQQPEEESFFEIHWIDANGGDLNYVTTVELAEALRFHPQAFWNADGTRLYYRDPVERAKPDDPPTNDLVSVRLDGTDRKAHLRVPPVDNLLPSPDGRWVVFTSRDNVYVTALPPIQTEAPPEVTLKDGAVPVWRLSDAAGGYVAWADGGRTITWALGNTFHRLPLASAMQFVDEQKQKEREKQAATSDPTAKKDASPPEDAPRVPASETIPIALSMPRAAPTGSFVLQNARILTMNGRGDVIERGDIVVSGNRIAAAGPSGSVKIPDGARRFDAGGTTVIPGLIDTHAHLHYSGFEIFPETKWEYIANLAYGVTTVYDPSAPSLDVFAQGEMVEAGTMIGPRIYSSGDVLYGGNQASVFAEVNNVDDARRQVRRMKAYGARMIKVYQQARRDQRIWFAEAARELKMLVTAEGAGELLTDLTMMLDGYTAVEHSLPVGISDDVARLAARSGTYYTPTLIVSYGGPTAEYYFWQTRNPHDDPKLNHFVPHRLFDVLARRRMWVPPDEYQFMNVAAGAAKIVREGGKVTLGAHGQLQGLGAHWELWALAGEGQAAGQEGLSPMNALRAATIVAAEKIGFGPDLGSVESGKLADLVVLDADPLADIHNTTKIRWVVKNGEVYDAGTMRQEWPAQKPLPPFFWRTQ
jgi:imidazolonepropionase-like amidohydrolase/Tol biopolymer transport system component